jgi:chromosomal replication initiator protein
LELPAHLEFTPAWNDICTELRRTVGDTVYEIWLSRLQVAGWDGSNLRIDAEPEKGQWIADRFGRVLDRCARHVLGDDVRVALAVQATGQGEPFAGAGSRAGTSDDPLLARFIPRYTFDQFIIGDGNRLAHAAALAVAEAPGQAYNPLFLHAPPGLGKTHLLHAIGNYITRFDHGTIVRYTTVEGFTNGFLAALNGRALERFKHLYREADVLLIDDVQFLMRKAKTEEEFFHTFNALHDAGHQLVLTCDRLPEQLLGIEERLRERFEAGLVARLTQPDLATRIAILRKRAALDNISVPEDEVLELIAKRVTDNIRSLEGTLIRVVAHHSLTGQPIDVCLTRSVLDDIHPQSAADVLDPGRVQAVVARHFALSGSELISSSRAATVAWPRQLAIFLTRELIGLSFAEIGAAFGGRNHATVLHACRRVTERTAASTEDSKTLADLFAALDRNRADRSC